jgi:hypothetical protein
MVAPTCAKCGGTGVQCQQHPLLRWPHAECTGPGVPCEEPGCTMSTWLDPDDERPDTLDEDEDDI